MLWRSSYHTVRGELLPGSRISLFDAAGKDVALQGASAVVLSPTPSDYRERELWLRLFRAELPVPFRIGFRIGEPRPMDWESFFEAHPKSIHPLAVCCTSEFLRNIEATNGNTIALVLRGHEPSLMMIGPPNEEAWDQFLQAAIAAQTEHRQP